MCAKKCQAEAIRFDDQDQLVTEEVGAIVVATGFQALQHRQGAGRRHALSGYGEYGYGRYPDVIDSLQFERLVSASGPHRRRNPPALRRPDAQDGGVHQLRRLARQRQGPLLLLEDLLHGQRQAHHALQAQGA